MKLYIHTSTRAYTHSTYIHKSTRAYTQYIYTYKYKGIYTVHSHSYCKFTNSYIHVYILYIYMNNRIQRDECINDYATKMETQTYILRNHSFIQSDTQSINQSTNHYHSLTLTHSLTV